MMKKIKCHQYLGGRFHEGYGRSELSRAVIDGKLKQTIDYETMNLEGRNNFIQDKYCVFELVPTHVDWKQPGVFCITNNTEKGSQAARTYGIIPESGDIKDAFDILITKPQISLEDFSAYDQGEKQLTWLENEYEDAELVPGSYRISDGAKGKLGQFIAAFWEAMSIRMNDPDTEEKMILNITVQQSSDIENDSFPYLVRFFANEIVSRLPNAVRPMTSVSFGVPWSKRNSHKGVVCYVQSDDKDQRINQSFGFLLDPIAKTVEISENSHVGTAEESMQDVASVLMKGPNAYPEVYIRMEKHFADHPIVKSYDVFELLVESEKWKEKLLTLDQNTRAGKIRKFISENKKQYYDILFYTLTKNCKCSTDDAFYILLPTLQSILEIMDDIEPGTEFQSGFTPADISFFAACRKQLLRAEENEMIANKLDQILINNYQIWGEMNFAASFLKNKNEDQDSFPQELFLNISTHALKNEKVNSKEVIDRLKTYIQSNYKLDYTSEKDLDFVSALMRYEESVRLSDDSIESWGNWLAACSKTDVKKDIGPYATVYLQLLEKCEQSDLGEKKTAGLLESLLKFDSYKDTYSKAERLLLKHFCSWSKNSFMVDPGDRQIHKEGFYSITQKWLDEIESNTDETYNEEKEETIKAIQLYCQDYPQENEICLIAEKIFRYLCREKEITKEIYISEREWIQDACNVNEKKAFVLLLILAEKLFESNETMLKAGVGFVGDHMDELARHIKNPIYETNVNVDSLIKRETEFLIENFAKWRQSESEKDFIKNQDIEILRDMVEQWQNDGLLESNLGYTELQSIYDSLIPLKSKDGKKLDLSVLEKQKARVQLREIVAKANKEKNYNEDVLKAIAEIRQKVIALGIDENDDDLINANRILISNFHSWSKIKFESGEGEPDESFIQLAKEWVESINPSKITFKELDEIAVVLSEVPCILLAKDKAFLEDLNRKSYDSMKTQSKNTETVDNDESFLDRLVSYYSNEDTDEASGQRRDICKKLSEAYRRSSEKPNSKIFEKASHHIKSILEGNHHIIPDEAKRDEVWAKVRKELVNQAVGQMLSRFATIKELQEQKLKSIWNEDYAKEYSVEWRELYDLSQSDLETVVNQYIEKIYSDKTADNKLNDLKYLRELSQESGRSNKSITAIERKFLTKKFDADYNALWINASSDVRKEIDGLYDEISQNDSLDIAKYSDARKARLFSESYSSEILQENEIKDLLKQIIEYPEWKKYLHMNDLNNSNSMINISNKKQETSAIGIGMRLIHDITNIQTNDGSYWEGIIQSFIPWSPSVNQLKKMNLWAAENGRILNAFFYLSSALSELGEGGEKAAGDLKKWLSAEAPEFLMKLGDEQLATKLWDEWDKLLSDNRIYQILVR